MSCNTLNAELSFERERYGFLDRWVRFAEAELARRRDALERVRLHIAKLESKLEQAKAKESSNEPPNQNRTPDEPQRPPA